MLMIFISILIASTLIGLGVHFIPVGGAPAALSTSSGVPTGAPMITIGMGITGILVTSLVLNKSLDVILLSGVVSSVLMLAVTMLFSNIIHVYGVGVPISSAAYKKDVITGFSQEEYVSPSTTGHGIPTISFISGIIGAALGGFGGSLLYSTIYNCLQQNSLLADTITISALMSVLMFFIMAVLSSYNIGGTIQGVTDNKFKAKIKTGLLSSLALSVVLSLTYMIILWGIII